MSSIPLLANSNTNSLGCRAIAILACARADSDTPPAPWSCGGFSMKRCYSGVPSDQSRAFSEPPWRIFRVGVGVA